MPNFFSIKFPFYAIKEYRERKKEFYFYFIAIFTWMLIYTIPFLLLYTVIGSTPLFLYSNGEMQGTSAKMSTKGLIFKTNEGYIMSGGLSNGTAERLYFSTRDNNIINCVNNNQRVKITYEQYLIVPSIIGSSNHIATKCEKSI